MADLFGYTVGEAGNNDPSPNGWPENMARSGVNNSDREFAAAVRTWADDPEWLDLMRVEATGAALTITKETDTSIRIANRDVQSFFNQDRRVKLTGGATQYGSVSSASLSGSDTIVVLTMDNAAVVDGSTNKVELYFAATLKAQAGAGVDPVATQAFG